MGRSVERKGFSGNYTEHFDDDGNKIGESRERNGFSGKYTEYTDTGGRKAGESRSRKGFSGDYVEHTDSRGYKQGESRQRDGFSGPYTVHTDSAGNKIGESRNRESIFGDYTEHIGEFHPRHKYRQSSDSSDSEPESYGSYTDGRPAAHSNISPLAILPVIAIVVIAIVLIAGWWVRCRNEKNAFRQLVEQQVNLAVAKVNNGELISADQIFYHALELAKDLGSDDRRAIAKRRNELYIRIDIPPNGVKNYKLVGRVRMLLGNPVVCLQTPERCGYKFESKDESILYTSSNNIVVRSTTGFQADLKGPLMISEIVPVGVEYCCRGEKSSEAPHKLFFHNVDRYSASVYVRRQYLW